MWQQEEKLAEQQARKGQIFWRRIRQNPAPDELEGRGERVAKRRRMWGPGLEQDRYSGRISVLEEQPH